MLRICVYHYDMGAFRRVFIQSVTELEFAKLKKSDKRRVLILPENDWYGMSAPTVYVEETTELNINAA